MRSGFGSGHWDETYRGEIYNNLIGADPYLPYHPFTGQDQPLGGDTDFNWGANDVNEDSYQDPLRAQFVIDHLIGGVPEPFFVMLGTRCTHYPAMPPREYLERFNPETVTLPPYFDADLDDIPEAGIELIQMNLLDSTKAHKHYHEAICAYLATINFVDDVVGGVLQSLADSPYADNTVVAITADHGLHLGEKHHWRKRTLWEESTHVYLAMRAPGVTEPGGVCTEAVSLLDLYPTLVDLCDLEPNGLLDGISLMRQLLDPSAAREPPALTTYGPGNHAVRSDRWRYIRYADGSEELYDHDSDPNEWTNVAGDPQYEDVKQWLAQWMPRPGAAAGR